MIGWAGLTFASLLHGTKLRWGLRLLNILGVIKVIIVIIVIITGFVALGGHLKVPKPHNFSHAFEGTTASAPSFCLSLYNVSGVVDGGRCRHLSVRRPGYLVVHWLQ